MVVRPVTIGGVQEVQLYVPVILFVQPVPSSTVKSYTSFFVNPVKYILPPDVLNVDALKIPLVVLLVIV